MRTLGFLLSVILIFITLSNTTFAAEKHGWPTLSLSAGMYSFDDTAALDTELSYGVKLGYEINGKSLKSRLGIEAVYHQINATLKEQDEDIKVSLLRLDILYLFSPIKKLKTLTPFLSVGAGGRFIDSDSGSDADPVAAYGIGFKLPLSSALAFRADARHILVFADEQINEFEYTAGLHYTFGKPKKIKKKSQAVVDADKDGVVDTKDQCPETPAGMEVGPRGCPLNPPDTDKDGVPDYLDKCPETNGEYPVDAEGCLYDSDNDGVPDVFDKCPNNPPGFKVNADGCM